MKHTDDLVLQRTADIVASIRPLRKDFGPSKEFVRETRQLLLDHILPASLSNHRRRKTLTMPDESGQRRRSA